MVAGDVSVVSDLILLCRANGFEIAPGSQELTAKEIGVIVVAGDGMHTSIHSKHKCCGERTDWIVHMYGLKSTAPR